MQNREYEEPVQTYQVKGNHKGITVDKRKPPIGKLAKLTPKSDEVHPISEQ